MPIKTTIHSSSPIDVDTHSSSPVKSRTDITLNDKRLEAMIQQEILDRIAGDAYLQEQIDAITLSGAHYLRIEEHEDGQIDLSLLDGNYETLDTKSILSTGKLIDTINVDIEHAEIIFTCLNGENISVSIADILDLITAEETRAKEAENSIIERLSVIEADYLTSTDKNELKREIGAVVTDLTTHTQDTNNPHSVNKSQVGLGNVENYGQTANTSEGSSLYFTSGGAFTLKSSLSQAITDEATARTTTDSQLQTNIDAKQNIIDSNHKLSSDLVDDTNHAHKFATADQLTQISTNTTNISSEVDRATQAESALDGRLDNIEEIIPSDATTSNKLATEDYVDENGGKIDKIEVNSVEQTIINKTVNITVPTKTSDITNDSDFATNTYVDTESAKKVDKVNGKGLSTNDFTDALKNKLDNIEANAEVNIQANWSESDSSSDAYIQNKPSIYTQTETNNLLNAKADKIANGTENNIVTIDTNGNIKDSGKSFADTGKIDSISIDGTTVQPDQNKNVDLPPYPTKASLDIDDIEAVIPSDATISNKLATEDYVSIYGGKIDKIQAQGVDLPINNKVVNITKASLDIDDIENVIPSSATTSNKLATENEIQYLDSNVHIEGNSDEITYNGDTVTKTSNWKNLKTGSTGQRQEVIHLANTTTAGMMSPADYNQIRDNTSRIEALEGQTKRLLYTDSQNPTSQNIQDFVDDYLISKGITPSPEEYQGIAVVVAGTYHIWHYYNDDGWKDDGTDTVTQFTNSSPGVIQGKQADGFVYAENDGTGSVFGWSQLETKVSNNEDAIGSLQTGKQDKIDSNNLLDADLVDDSTSTNKFVTSQVLSDVSANTSARHTHSNKSTLDNITAAYTTEEQTKLSGIESSAEVNTIESITLNGTVITPDVNRNIALTDTGATSAEISGSGNAVTNVSYNASTRKLTLTKGSTFALSVDLNNYQPKDDKLTSISGLASDQTGVIKLTNGSASLTRVLIPDDMVIEDVGALVPTGTPLTATFTLTEAQFNKLSAASYSAIQYTLDSFDYILPKVGQDANNLIFVITNYQSCMLIAVEKENSTVTGTLTLLDLSDTYALKTDIPTTLPNPNSLGIKANSDSTAFMSYDGTSAKTLTISPSSTSGAFELSDGTTTKTIQLVGQFTDNNTTYTFAEGSTNGAFSVTPSGGTAQIVSIHGLGSNAYTSTDIPTTYVKSASVSGSTLTLTKQDNTTVTFTDTDTNTWRPIQVAGVEYQGSAITTEAMNFKNDGNVQFTFVDSTAAPQTADGKIGVKASVDLSAYALENNNAFYYNSDTGRYDGKGDINLGEGGSVYFDYADTYNIDYSGDTLVISTESLKDVLDSKANTSDIPTNYVTTDTAQTIGATKTINNDSSIIFTYTNSANPTYGGIKSKYLTEYTILKPTYVQQGYGGYMVTDLSAYPGDDNSFIRFNSSVQPVSNNTLNLGHPSQNFAHIYSVNLHGTNLSLSGIMKNGSGNYGISIPTTTSYTANKTLATTSDFSVTTTKGSESVSANGSSVPIKNIYYVEGNTTDEPPTWTATCSDITSYYTGLTITFKIGTAGKSGTDTTLNINNLGAKRVYENTSTNPSTHYSVGTILFMVYDETADSGNGGWKISGDRVGTDSQNVRTYNYSATNYDRDLLCRQDTAAITAGSYTAKYVATTTKAKINTSTGKITSDGGFAITNGTSSQFLKADGSTDSNSYITGIDSSDVTTALGYTPYNSTNPNGYTSNTGTVTSVTIQTSGTGISGGSSTAITSTGTRTITLKSSSAGNANATDYPVVLRNANGTIQSDTFAVSSSGTTKANITYDSTNHCIVFNIN